MEKNDLQVSANEAAKKPAKTDSAKKNKPAEKKRKTGGIARYLREMKNEMKKVAWPSKKQTLNNTGVVIVCVIIVGIFVWIFDGIAGQFIGALLNLFGR